MVPSHYIDITTWQRLGNYKQRLKIFSVRAAAIHGEYVANKQWSRK